MANTVSVIIPTKNRPIDLDLTVKSLFQQSVLPIQLIIVDQSQTEESKERVERLFAESPFALRGAVHLCYVRDSTISGGAVARNRAMEMAHGDIWFFLDDDVVLEAAFVQEILAVYQQHSNVSAVSGIISNYQRPSFAPRLWASVFVRGPFHDERQPIYWKANSLRNAEPIAVRKLGAGLMSFRAEEIRAHRFDESLTGVSDGEDVDFCVRLGSDAVLMIAPRARLMHKASPIGRAPEHWLRRFARANYFLYYRNWRMGIRNRLVFLWLNVGVGFAASLASARHGALAPWRALREGAREGRRLGRPEVMAGGKPARAPTGRARFGCRL